MKIYTDSKGIVHSSGSGSIEEQYAQMVAILAYLQRRTNDYEQIVAKSQSVNAPKNEATNARK